MCRRRVAERARAQAVNEITAAALTISIENLFGAAAGSGNRRRDCAINGSPEHDARAALNRQFARFRNLWRMRRMNCGRRSPLSGPARSWALRRSRPAEAYRDALQQIAAESERMTTLVEDLLILARSDTESRKCPGAGRCSGSRRGRVRGDAPACRVAADTYEDANRQRRSGHFRKSRLPCIACFWC